MTHMITIVSDPEARLAAHVLSLCASDGGGVSESLDRAAATLREWRAVDDERHASGAQARLSSWVLTLLPFAFGAWSALSSNDVRAFLSTPLGLATWTAGIALNACGWLAMNRMIRVVS